MRGKGVDEIGGIRRIGATSGASSAAAAASTTDSETERRARVGGPAREAARRARRVYPPACVLMTSRTRGSSTV